MTKTTNLGLNTWVKTDEVNVDQISANFQTLDAVCARADRIALIGSGASDAECDSFTVPITGWSSKFSRLVIQHQLYTNSKSAGADVSIQVTAADGTSGSFKVGVCSETGTAVVNCTGEAMLVRGGESQWDVLSYSFFGTTAKALSNSGRYLSRVALAKSAAPASLTVSVTRPNAGYSSYPKFTTGCRVTVYGVV